MNKKVKLIQTYQATEFEMNMIKIESDLKSRSLPRSLEFCYFEDLK